MMQYVKFSSPKAFCIRYWKVTGVLQSPKSIRVNLQNPRFPTVKVVYCWDLGAILTCQNLLLKSILEKCVAPAILSNASWIHGKGYESFFMYTLSLQESTQKCSDPSFFLTNTTALHHGDWLGCIAPTSSISQSEVHTSSKDGGGICLNHSLNGSLSVMWISCLIALVQPSSFPSNKKMLWKAKMRS